MKKLTNVFFIFGLIFIFLGLIDFFSFSGLFLVCGCLLLVLYCIFCGLNRFDIHYLLILIFTISFVLFSVICLGFSAYYLISYFMLPISLYIFSRNFAYSSIHIASLLFVFVFGYFTRSILIVCSSVLQQGFHFVNYLTSPNWYNSSNVVYMARNGLSLFLLPLFSCSIVLLFSGCKFKKNWFILLSAILYDIFAIVVSLLVGNRAFNFVFILLFITKIAILMSGFNFRAFSRRKKIVIISLLCLAGLLILTFVLMLFGVIPIPSFLLNIYGIRRIFSGGSDSDRIKLYIAFFENFFKYPFGGMYNYFGRFVHNFILDIYTTSGIVPFITFLFLFVIFLLDYFDHRKNNVRKSDSYISSIIIWIIFSYTILGFMEPLFQTDNFMCSVFIFGFGYFRSHSDRKLFNFRSGTNRKTEICDRRSFKEINI